VRACFADRVLRRQDVPDTVELLRSRHHIRHIRRVLHSRHHVRIVPGAETKNKSLQEIQDELSGKKKPIADQSQNATGSQPASA